MLRQASSLVAILLLCITVHAYRTPNWSYVDEVIQSGMVNVTPGVVAIVGTKNGIIYSNSFGRLTYGVPPPFDPIDPPMTLLVCDLVFFSIFFSLLQS